MRGEGVADARVLVVDAGQGLAFVDEHVGRVHADAHLLDGAAQLTVEDLEGLRAAEAFAGQARQLEGRDTGVVVLEPRGGFVGLLAGAARLDEGIIVAGVGRAGVDDDARQVVLVVFVGLVEADGQGARGAQRVRFGVAVFFEQTLGRVGFQIDFQGELDVVVDFEVAHLVVVKVEALEMDEQEGRQRLDTAALDGIALFSTFLAGPGVVAGQGLALHEELQGFGERLFVLDVDGQGVEGLLPFAAVGAAAGQQLVSQAAAEDGVEQARLLGASQ